MLRGSVLQKGWQKQCFLSKKGAGKGVEERKKQRKQKEGGGQSKSLGSWPGPRGNAIAVIPLQYRFHHHGPLNTTAALLICAWAGQRLAKVKGDWVSGMLGQSCEWEDVREGLEDWPPKARACLLGCPESGVGWERLQCMGRAGASRFPLTFHRNGAVFSHLPVGGKGV